MTLQGLPFVDRLQAWGELRRSVGQHAVANDIDRATNLIVELYEALDEICSEFAQGHPLIVAGAAVLAKAREDSE